MPNYTTVILKAGDKEVFRTNDAECGGCLSFGEDMDAFDALNSAIAIYSDAYESGQVKVPLADITVLSVQQGDGFKDYDQAAYDALSAKSEALWKKFEDRAAKTKPESAKPQAKTVKKKPKSRKP